VAFVAVGASGAIAVLRDGGLIHFDLPQAKRLIPPRVATKPPVRASAQFGFEMGTGFRTYLTATGPDVVALAVLIGRPGLHSVGSLVIGCALGRTFPLWVAVHGPRRLESAVSGPTWNWVKVTLTSACVVFLAAAMVL
jgi:hypothetical protein